MRKIKFVNDNYYHIYNRGVDKRRIFLRNGHYIRFIETLNQLLFFGTAQKNIETSTNSSFNNKLDFICYVLMPNHYHFLIKQKEDKAITEFMHKINTSYTKFFNLNNKRTGRLFEYTFKAVLIESDEQLIHVSRYIHLNPLVSNLVTNLDNYKWSSYLDYVGKRNGKLVNKDEILGLFNNNPSKYGKFVLDHIDYARLLHKIKKIALD